MLVLTLLLLNAGADTPTLTPQLARVRLLEIERDLRPLQSTWPATSMVMMSSGFSLAGSSLLIGLPLVVVGAITSNATFGAVMVLVGVGFLVVGAIGLIVGLVGVVVGAVGSVGNAELKARLLEERATLTDYLRGQQPAAPTAVPLLPSQVRSDAPEPGMKVAFF